MSKYTAEELYDMSASRGGEYRYKRMHSVLTNRVWALLNRSGLFKNGEPDRKKILEYVESGRIFSVRNCGKTTVKQLCEWLCMEDNTVLSEDDEN